MKTTQFKLFKNLGEYKILMLGDSLTDYGSWSKLLQRDDIQNHGISGDTTKGVLERLQYINRDIKKIFIMIGINDILVGKKIPYIFQNYKKIIDNLQQREFKIYIQSTLYTGKSVANNYNDKVFSLNNLLIKYCKEKNIDFIDINQELSTNNIMKDIYSNDDLHINESGYKAWSKALKPYL